MRGGGAAPHRGRGVKIKIARECWVGVAREARASCSGEHVVPSASLLRCHCVCEGLQLLRLFGLSFIHPQHGRPPLRSRSTCTFTSTSRASFRDGSRDCPQPGRGHFIVLERGKACVCVCRKVCESAGESVSGLPLLILSRSQLVVRS